MANDGGRACSRLVNPEAFRRAPEEPHARTWRSLQPRGWINLEDRRGKVLADFPVGDLTQSRMQGDLPKHHEPEVLGSGCARKAKLLSQGIIVKERIHKEASQDVMDKAPEFVGISLNPDKAESSQTGLEI